MCSRVLKLIDILSEAVIGELFSQFFDGSTEERYGSPDKRRGSTLSAKSFDMLDIRVVDIPSCLQGNIAGGQFADFVPGVAQSVHGLAGRD